MNIDKFNKIKGKFDFQAGLHGKNEYFNSVVLVLMMEVDGQYHFVFQKRNANIRQGGEICFPGGKVDPEDDSLVKVALRETKEEMGIPEEKLQIIGRMNTMLTPAGVLVDAFLGIADIMSEDIHINTDEVESYFTIPVAYFMDTEPERYHAQVVMQPNITNADTGETIDLFPAAKLGLPDRYSKPWGNYQHSILVYQTEYGVIWGITARFIYECVENIKEFDRSQD